MGWLLATLLAPHLAMGATHPAGVPNDAKYTDIRLTKEGAWVRAPGESVWVFRKVIPRASGIPTRVDDKISLWARAMTPAGREALARACPDLSGANEAPTTVKVSISPAVMKEVSRTGVVFGGDLAQLELAALKSSRTQDSKERAKPTRSTSTSGCDPTCGGFPPPRSIFFEDFEDCDVLGQWTTVDLNTTNGQVLWYDRDNLCGRTYRGYWSAYCAGSSNACHTYSSSQNSVLETDCPISVAAEAAFAIEYWQWYDISIGDRMRMSVTLDGAEYIIDTTESGYQGWTYKKFRFVNETFDSQLRVRFVFQSDSNDDTVAEGVYIDDVNVEEAQVPPNLQPGTIYPTDRPVFYLSEDPFGTDDGALYAGEPVWCGYSVRNIGSESARGPFDVTFARRTVGGFTTTQMGQEFEYFDLAPHTDLSRPGAFSSTVPFPGVYDVRMTVDSLGSVDESASQEDDNGLTRTLTWVWPPVDLRVLSVDITPNPPTVGQDARVTIQVTNLGPHRTSSTFKVAAYEASDPVAIPSECDLSNSQFVAVTGGLAPGEIKAISFALTQATVGTKFLFCRVDASCDVLELDETDPAHHPPNNTAGPYTMNWRPGTLTISGNAQFSDPLAGRHLAIDRALVVIWKTDNANAHPSALGTVRVRTDGSWGPIALEDIDSATGETLNLFYELRIDAGNDALLGSGGVYPPYGSVPYHYVSGIVPHVAPGTYAFPPIVLGGGLARAAHILETLNVAADHMRGLTLSAPYAAVWFHPDVALPTHYVDDNNVIQVAGGAWNEPGSDDGGNALTAPDDLDDMTVLHEYGHMVSFRAGNPLVSGVHTPSWPEDATLAWGEAWAYYFGALVGGHGARVFRDKRVSVAGDSTIWTIDLENGDVDLYVESGHYNAPPEPPFGGPPDDGAYYEIPILGALYDLTDAQDDDVDGRGCLDHVAIATAALETNALYGCKPNSSVCTFWAGLRSWAGGAGIAVGAINDAFCEHGIKCLPDVRLGAGLLAEGECGGVLEVPPNLAGGEISLTASPNPARGLIRLRLAGNRQGVSKVAAYDVVGRKVWGTDVAEGTRELVWRPGSEGGVQVESGILWVVWAGMGWAARTAVIVER